MLGRSQTLSRVLQELKKKKERKESFGVARQLCDKSWRASWDVRKKQELTLIKEQPSAVPFLKKKKSVLRSSLSTAVRFEQL